MTVFQSSVDIIQVNFPMVTSFLQDLLRSSVFTSAAILALIDVILLLNNNESSSLFDAEKENCRGVAGIIF